jgi:amino acid adenylation domain-containing protein
MQNMTEVNVRPPVDSTALTAAERRRMLVEWNQTEREYPRDKCVHQLFEEQAERSPDAVAVVFEDQSLTYGELNARANQLAHHLVSLGVGPDMLVGLCVERSLEMVVGLLGILKAGGAYVPLDPSLPMERLGFCLQDSAALILVTQQALSGRFSGLESLRLVILEQGVGEAPVANLARRNRPADLAYVMYTSGSTGTPKGVEISHQALVNCLGHFQHSLDLRPPDAWLSLTTLSFDIAGLELWAPLLAGARVIVGTHAHLIDGTRLSRVLNEQQVTILQATPATWRMLLQSGWPGKASLQMLCGGEALPQELADRLAGLGGRAWNVYGPTETTIWSTTRQLAAHQPVDIGRPLANTRVYVLDAQGQPQPVGVPGELCIGGDGVARGYRNRPELTAERFIPDPFGKQEGARLYRTGDLARWRADGNLEFLGRTDQQVKIRGFRIELGEIEAVLGGHPAVAACAVLVQDRSDGDKMLTAYVVGRKQPVPSSEELRQWVGRKLPEYMIPNLFVRLDQLPLNFNGKVDRTALARLNGVELTSGADYVAPRHEGEQALAEIWQAVLHRERVGIRDDFFALGGHSLLGAQVAARIRQKCGVEIPLRAVFEHPTLAALAALLLAKKTEADGIGDMERMLAELEALTDEAAAELLQEANERRVSGGDPTKAPSSAYHCPEVKSPWFGRRRCNLVILLNEDFERESFERVARWVREFDPSINPVVLRDQADAKPELPPHPTLTFSPAVARHPPANCGKIFCGFPLSKSQEYAALEKAGISVPKWVLLAEGAAPDLTGFDQYVVQKPDYGGKGAEVKVVRTGRVRWKPITTQAAGTSSSLIIQELIYTGPQPVSYRVNTLFGKVLYSVRYESTRKPVPRAGADRETPAQQWGSIVASARGSQVSLNDDEEIIRLGETAAGAFPDIPLLGFDIVREAASGKLYVLEANAIGYVWNFRASQTADYGFSSEKQFDGVRKAAWLLAEKTQQYADGN